MERSSHQNSAIRQLINNWQSLVKHVKLNGWQGGVPTEPPTYFGKVALSTFLRIQFQWLPFIELSLSFARPRASLLEQLPRQQWSLLDYSMYSRAANLESL